MSKDGKGGATDVPKVAPADARATAPALAWYTDHILFHDVWNRPGLSRRDRSLVTVSALIACSHWTQLKSHMNLGLSNGLTPLELAEVVTHLAFFVGWPSSMSALNVMRQVLSDRGVDAGNLGQSISEDASPVLSEAEKSVESRGYVETLAPYIDRLIHNDLWKRPELSSRDRSLASVVAIIAAGAPEDLSTYASPRNGPGLSTTELKEALLHVAFYAGMPRAVAAARILDATQA